MAIVIKKMEGSLPVSRQEYTEGTTYYKNNIVTRYGSAFLCVVESTTTPPATLDESGSVVPGKGWVFFADTSAISNAVAEHTEKITKIEQLQKEGYTFMGVATPKTNPGTPDQKVFYIANGKGTYANFGGLAVDDDTIAIFYWDSAWHKSATNIANIAAIYESSTYISNNPNAWKYGYYERNEQKEIVFYDEFLSGQRIRLKTPFYVKKGMKFILRGHDVKFILAISQDGVHYDINSDWISNEYNRTYIAPISGMCMVMLGNNPDSVISNIEDISDLFVVQDVTDIVDVNHSIHSVVNGEIVDFTKLTEQPLYDDNGTWKIGVSGYSSYIVRCIGGMMIQLVGSNTGTDFSLVRSIGTQNQPIEYAGDTTRTPLPPNSTKVVVIPPDTNYIYVSSKIEAIDVTPSSLIIRELTYGCFRSYKQSFTDAEKEQMQSNIGLDIIYAENIISDYGYVSRDGTIVTSNSGSWHRSKLIKLDEILSDNITLSVTCNGNASTPKAAAMVGFDSEMNPVHIVDDGFITLPKSNLPSGVVYLMFSFYLTTSASIDSYGVLNSIINLNKRIKEITGIPNDAIRKEEKENLYSAIGKPTIDDVTLFNFIHTSDTHLKADNDKCFKNIVSLAKEPYISAIVHTGDILWDYFSDSIQPLVDALSENTKDYIFCVGNHDVGGESRMLSQCGSDIDVYNKFYAPFVKSNFVLGGVNKPYYYVDYPSHKIRFISLYQYNSDYTIDPNDSTKLKDIRGREAYRQDEIDWLCSTLNDTPDGYVVFVMAHAPESFSNVKTNSFQAITRLGYEINDKILNDLLVAFKERTTINKSYNQTVGVETTITVNADFSSATAYIGAMLNGHLHDDYVGLDGTGKINVINKSCDNMLYQTGNSIRKVANTYNENTINVVSVDTQSRVISVFRIGAKYSINGDYRNVTYLKY